MFLSNTSEPNLTAWFTLQSRTWRTLTAAVARHQPEHGQEGPDVTQPARLVLQLLVHRRLVHTLEHVALHLAQRWEQRVRLGLLP